jgi:nucleoid-associated protein YgaU
MGRETKILLGLLGLLAGVFVGVLSMKLLVPRPPTGAGPDIHADVASSETHDLVEPPRFGMRASDFASAPPLTPPLDAPPASQELPDPPAGSRFAMPRQDSAKGPTAEPASPAGPRRDPFVAAASFEPAAVPESRTTGAEFTGGDSTADDSRFAATRSAEPPQQPPLGTPRLITPSPAIGPMAGAGYVVQEGDSWWSVAERAYGDGRLYRALFAWNRGLNPRITLAVGTPLEIPPRSRLAVAWPRFMPQE